MVSKSLIQFSGDGWGCVSSFLLTWVQTMEVMKFMVTSFKMSMHALLHSAPSHVAGHCWPTPPLETLGHSRIHLGQSLVGSLLLSPRPWCTQVSVCALQESVSPVLCKFWWLYGGVNSDLLQESLCHTQVCRTQSPCPCSSPLQTRTSSGDTQTQFCLSLCGLSGSWCAQGLFELSECLWWEWVLILNTISPLLPSCWGFSALGYGISLHSCSNTAQMKQNYPKRRKEKLWRYFKKFFLLFL